MASRNINVLLTGNATSLRSTLVAAGRDVEAFERKAEGLGKSGSRSMQLWSGAAKAGGLVVAAALTYAVFKAAEFETQMQNVNSISKLSEGALASLGDEVVNLSTQLPQSAADLAAGLYDIASSGFQGAEGLMILRSAAVAASAGMTDTATSSAAIVSVINAYGLAASDAAHVSNVLFQGVNVGVMTFEELAGTVGDFVGTAAAAGVGIEDATAALATMTLSGISAAEAGTSLNRVLQSVIDPSDALAEQFKVLGYESGSTALKQKGLDGVMKDLMKSSQGNIDVLLAWFPEIRAARGALALMAAEGQNYARASAAMKTADEDGGAARQAMNEQMKATGAQFKLFVNQINAGAIALGQELLPAVKAGISGLTELGGIIASTASEIADRLGPAIESLQDAWNAVYEAASNLVTALAPLGSILAGVFGGAALIAIIAVAEGIQQVSEFLADHAGLVQVAAIAWGLYAAAALAASIAENGVPITRAEAALAALIPKIKTAIGSWAALASVQGVTRTSLTLLGSALTSTFAILASAALIINGVVQNLNTGKDAARDFAAEVNKDLDTSSLDSYRAAIGKIREEQQRLAESRAGSGFFQDLGSNIVDVIVPFHDLENSAMDVGSQLKELGSQADDLEGPLGKASRGVDRLAKEMAKQQGLKLPSQIRAIRDNLLELAAANKVDFSGPYADWSQQLVDLAFKQGATTGSTAKMREGFQTVAGAADDAEAELDGFKTALDGIFGASISVFDAQTAHAESIKGLAESVLTYGNNLDAVTEGGQSNRQALSEATQSAIDYSNAVASQKGPAAGVKVFKVLYDQIHDVMRQMGLTEKQAEDMAAAIGLTPQNLAFTMGLEDTDTAAAQIEAWKAEEERKKGVEVEVEPKMGPANPWKEQVKGELFELIATFEDPANSVRVGIDQTEAMQRIDGLQLALKDWAAQHPKAAAGLDSTDAETRLDTLNGWLEDYAKSHPEAKALLDNTPAEHKMGLLNIILEAYNGRVVSSTARANTGQAESDLNHVSRPRIAEIRAQVILPQSGVAALGSLRHRWGGVNAYAHGGITPAHVARGEIYKYAEPETGGEAFVPRRGSASRSLAVLGTAAEWYGHKIVPMVRGGVVSAAGGNPQGAGAPPLPSLQVHVFVGDREITDIVKTEIRTDKRKTNMAGKAK
jgi:TP901 family phage tail tape measure protein